MLCYFILCHAAFPLFSKYNYFLFLQQTTKTKSRKTRSSPKIDYGACTVRITSVQSTKVQLVLLCPSGVQGNMEPKDTQAFVCALMFTSGKSTSCGGSGAMMTPMPPTTYPPLEPMT